MITPRPVPDGGHRRVRDPVFVTGATGLLGSNVVAELLARDRRVVALVRDLDRARRLLPADERLRLVRGDVTDPDSFAPALRGSGAVIHTAAYLSDLFAPGFDAETMHRTNVVAVTELLRAASAADVPVVVHTSSTSTVGPAAGRAPADETAAAPVHRYAYHDSKLHAEEAVREFCERTQLRVPMVLPGCLWGPGDAAPTPMGRIFVAAARRELPAMPKAGYYMVDARDVAAACIRAIDDGVGLRRYIVAGVRRTLWEACAAVARLVGVRPPLAMPVWASYPLSAMMEIQARLRRTPSSVNRLAARMLIESDRVRLSSARAQRELGVSFRPFEQTLIDEAAWFRGHGVLR